jgi:hypothetical protein
MQIEEATRAAADFAGAPSADTRSSDRRDHLHATGVRTNR